ncbi:MAG TPA: cobalamin-binding protein [Spirochaetaceae bacterium]|nr:cobalamin-binding protein [Spirochaetaceae bacterium]
MREFLSREKLLAKDGGTLRGVFFAGLPEACQAVLERFPDTAEVFSGDETPHETMKKLGIPQELMPTSMSEGLKYDNARMAFGRSLVASGAYQSVKPPDRSGYKNFGVRGDRLVDRIALGRERGLPPLTRVHAGPYLNDRREAVKLFLDWTRRLASGGYLDVLSIGSSQLTQSNFGESWEGKSNGGGVPISSPEEFQAVWEAARPMLVRTYAGTKDVPALARINEKTLDIAWHALSLWWFCQLDGRGPNAVLDNLGEHFSALRYIASTGKPFEPNVPHHFAFRGTDDLGYVISGYVAAKAAKLQGIGFLVLQVMLNTPKYLWGIQDLAKARVLLRLVRKLEGPGFKVYLQPRGGLDYFSPDAEKAKAQLAAVTAMMDDIEPGDSSSPQIIHVVSYSEAFRLADPEVMEESIKISLYALEEYRRLRARGALDDMGKNEELAAREEELYRQAKAMIGAIETLIPDTYTPRGLYEMLKLGVFPLPWLTNLKDEFPNADIPTGLVQGGVKALDEKGSPLPVERRIETIRENITLAANPGGYHGKV